MSQERVEALRRGYEVFNRRDIDAWLEGFHPDVEVHDLAGIPDAPVRRGHDALREWVAMMDGIWVDARYEPEEFIEAGEFVVVAVRAKGRGRGSRHTDGRPPVPGVRDSGRNGSTYVGLSRPLRSPRSGGAVGVGRPLPNPPQHGPAGEAHVAWSASRFLAASPRAVRVEGVGPDGTTEPGERAAHRWSRNRSRRLRRASRPASRAPRSADKGACWPGERSGPPP